MTSGRRLLRLALAIGVFSGVMALSVSCLGSDSGDSAADRKAIRQLADGLIQAINERDYAWIVSHLDDTSCDVDITEEQQRQAWEQVGQELGDVDYSVEIRGFSVTVIEDDRARVTSTVVIHAAGAEYPFGDVSDPVFDLFVKEDGEWKAVAC